MVTPQLHYRKHLIYTFSPFVAWKGMSVQERDQLADSKSATTLARNQCHLRAVNVLINLVCTERHRLRGDAPAVAAFGLDRVSCWIHDDGPEQ